MLGHYMVEGQVLQNDGDAQFVYDQAGPGVNAEERWWIGLVDEEEREAFGVLLPHHGCTEADCQYG